MTHYLEFEKPLAEIEGKAEELRAMARPAVVFFFGIFRSFLGIKNAAHPSWMGGCRLICMVADR